jgi:Zn-dependent oligopeptidase
MQPSRVPSLKSLCGEALQQVDLDQALANAPAHVAQLVRNVTDAKENFDADLDATGTLLSAAHTFYAQAGAAATRPEFVAVLDAAAPLINRIQAQLQAMQPRLQWLATQQTDNVFGPMYAVYQKLIAELTQAMSSVTGIVGAVTDAAGRD